MKTPDPPQDYEDNLTHWHYTGLMILLYLAGCGVLAGAIYAAN